MRPAVPDLVARLPEHLAERCRTLGATRCGAPALVVHWTHHALRVDEQPALETAAAFAAMLDASLVTIAGLGGAHRFNSDRHATFQLEGWRDLGSLLAARGGVFLASPRIAAPGESLLATLARHAALVVTDEMPAPPVPRWIAGLARRCGVPVVAVDSACVVPMPRREGGSPIDRAFVFRDRFAATRAERVARPWPVSAVEFGSLRRPDPALVELCATRCHAIADWTEIDIASIVADLPIDHSVGPVVDTPGGARAAEARWRAYLDGPIRRYARDRNDPLRGASSRMSAYLHAGMISPFRVAREAAAVGAEKYLDELLVWRELAYHWTFATRDPESIAALPAWARRTLEAARRDPRERLDDERLHRGRTGSRLWDLAQRSLLRHGELHNNLRMTWGKAILGWSRDEHEALSRLIDLNHRYALDGSDPSSYGGLLWCLGLFDRPFPPARPIEGEIRSRPVEEHAARLDVEAYARHVHRTTRPWRVAVIGAGVAGLAAARSLADQGVETVVFDKGRGPGGRISTRRSEVGAFDHGAPAFDARDPRFALAVERWVDAGVVAPWRALRVRIEGSTAHPRDDGARFVGVPAMSAIAEHLARDLDLRTSIEVGSIGRDGERWRLRGADGADLGAFDIALTTAPGPQSARLLETVAPDLAARIRARPMRPIWTAMLAVTEPIGVAWDHATFIDHPILGWAIRTSAKPQREAGERWTLHARPSWSAASLEGDASSVATELRDALFDLVGRRPETRSLVAHRWRFALGPLESGPDAHFDPRLLLGAAGDWCRGARLEDAWLSGSAIAGHVLRLSASLPSPREPDTLFV